MSNHDMRIETTDHEIIITRHFDAPPELVFAAHASCERLGEWWGPRSWPMAECTIDFRAGGIWHYCLRGPNEGDESWGRADYEEIVEPERIVYVDAFSDADGNVNEEMPRTRVVVELEAVDGRTKLTSTATYPDPAHLKTVVEMGALEGIAETIDRLAEHLERAVASGG